MLQTKKMVHESYIGRLVCLLKFASWHKIGALWHSAAPKISVSSKRPLTTTVLKFSEQETRSIDF